MIKGKELASLLGVSAASVSQAASKGHLCCGYDVGSWAVRSDNGRVRGYNVPPDVLAELRSGTAPRENPPPKPTGVNLSEANKLAELVSETPPKRREREGEHNPWVHPVALGGGSAVLYKAVEEDNASGQAVILAVGGLGGAVCGYEMSGRKAAGAAIGFLAVSGLLAWRLGLIKPHKPQMPQAQTQASLPPRSAASQRRAVNGQWTFPMEVSLGGSRTTHT